MLRFKFMGVTFVCYLYTGTHCLYETVVQSSLVLYHHRNDSEIVMTGMYA